ncbi:hypothetical protein D3C72_359940 [compost metagenome]
MLKVFDVTYVIPSNEYCTSFTTAGFTETVTVFPGILLSQFVVTATVGCKFKPSFMRNTAGAIRHPLASFIYTVYCLPPINPV